MLIETDVALFNGLLHVMLREGLVDHAYIAAHTEGFDALKERVRAYTPERVAGLDAPLATLAYEDPRRAPPRAASNAAKWCATASTFWRRRSNKPSPRAPTWPVRGAKLKCGSECGSCVPELKRMLAG